MDDTPADPTWRTRTRWPRPGAHPGGPPGRRARPGRCAGAWQRARLGRWQTGEAPGGDAGAGACRCQATCRCRASRRRAAAAVSAGSTADADTGTAAAGSSGTGARPGAARATGSAEGSGRAHRQEREWRQSTNKGVQFLALQYQATRCNQEDILAGNDDPNLPLVTCDKDHKQAYLLAPSIISGDQIENASSGLDQHSGGYVVDLQFKSGAANTWADFTAAHIGTQTAFTLDSQVVSAPQIREAIPGGRTQITGGDRHSPRTRHASSPTSSNTARCRCRSNHQKPKPSRRHWD